MRKTVLYIAESLDGFIAAPDGGVGWLTEQHPDGLEEGSYPEFIRTVDTVLMGYTTYHQIVTELHRTNGPMRGCIPMCLPIRRFRISRDLFHG